MHLIEDPPWAEAGARGSLHTDYVGLAFIVLGLGCLQVMLDRGEDDDWFGSSFIRLIAVLAAVGLVGGVYWLLYARKPIVDLRVFKDRNFAVGALMLFAMAMVMYASTVAMAQMAQQQFGYTATWAGLVLSPGAVVLILIIMLVTKKSCDTSRSAMLSAAALSALAWRWSIRTDCRRRSTSPLWR